MNDLIEQEPDLADKNISINNDLKQDNNKSESRESKTSSSSSQKGDNNSHNDTREVSIDKMIAKKFTEKARDEAYKSWVDRYICCFNWLKKYFQITSKDFYRRTLLSIIPFNTKFYDAIENSPDFYGPFWIYTTLIMLVSSCGGLTRTIQGKRDTNFFQEFIPTAAILIYFIGFGVPIFLAVLSKIFGASINIAPFICVYGYSYTIFLPVTIICSIPNQILQWILLAYAIFSSTSLIIMSISRTFASITKGKKLAVIIIICIFQVIIFFVMKLYFFKHLNKLEGENPEGTTLIENSSVPIQ